MKHLENQVTMRFYTPPKPMSTLVHPHSTHSIVLSRGQKASVHQFRHSQPLLSQNALNVAVDNASRSFLSKSRSVPPMARSYHQTSDYNNKTFREASRETAMILPLIYALTRNPEKQLLWNWSTSTQKRDAQKPTISSASIKLFSDVIYLFLHSAAA